MKITYIHHCGFLVETENEYLLFDYWKGQIPKMDHQKPIYVFASHVHADHYEPAIFDLEKEYDQVYYILSDDISQERILKDLGTEVLPKQLISVKKRKEYEVGQIKVKTHMSTDAGVAFTVYASGQKIVHMGDLNLWYWKKEADVFNNMQIKRFTKEVERLKEESYDVVFGPAMDHRLEENFSRGMLHFLENVQTKYIFPMHFWEDYPLIETFVDSEEMKPHKDRFMFIHQDHESWDI